MGPVNPLLIANAGQDSGEVVTGQLHTGWARTAVPAAGMLLLLLALVLLSWSALKLSDPQLEALLRDATGRRAGTLLVFHVAMIEELDATGRGITRLDGIERLGRLVRLNLEDNSIVDLSPLAGLGNLRDLSLRNNGITCLEAVRFGSIVHLPLQRLSLRHNVIRPEDAPQIRLSDIGLLSHLAGLTELELRDNHIADLSPLAGLTSLQVLDVSQNPIADGDISHLLHMRDLRELNLRETGVGDLSVLAQLRSLSYLNLHSNPEITDLSPLANLSELRELILAGVPLEQQSEHLSGLHNLNRINLRDTGLTDPSFLATLMSLGVLQDDDSVGIEASVDLRENPIPTLTDSGVDGYAVLRPYWDNVTNRQPETLP